MIPAKTIKVSDRFRKNTNWHKKFALFPKNINGEIVWLKNYYQRYDFIYKPYGYPRISCEYLPNPRRLTERDYMIEVLKNKIEVETYELNAVDIMRLLSIGNPLTRYKEEYRD